MGSLGNKIRPLGGAHNHPLCTRTHQIGVLLIVATTFFLTRLFDPISRSCSSPHLSADLIRSSRTLRPPFSDGGDLSWPIRGYGPYLDLKIYVYDENEIEGLKALMYGRDGTITAKDCLKGQWGTQVIFSFLIGAYFWALIELFRFHIPNLSWF